jgi:coenzyme F420-reducing hydrogenase alpha subunit
MRKKILLKQATRIEGNAQINIEVRDGKVDIARFIVMDFRGFERFTQGRRVEHVPQLISRICGLCSASHQVASLKAIEDALGVNTPPSVQYIRDIIVLGEWISSHALSYFFLSMPDFEGSGHGIFELIKTQPVITKEALSLRKAGQDITSILGKRAVHPVSLGIGGFLVPISADDLNEVRRIASEAKEKTAGLIKQIGNHSSSQNSIDFPSEQQLNFLVYDDRPDKDVFYVYDRKGEVKVRFKREEFEQNVSEMRADWSLAKLPYLETLGFPEGIMLVGPLSRSFMTEGIMEDPDIAGFSMSEILKDPVSLKLESYDICRLLEIYMAAKRIITLIDKVDIDDLSVHADIHKSGRGIGVVEAPRGVLIHSYLINRGCIERMRLLVATQFNNAYINLLIRDIAEKHLDGDRLSPLGQHLINRCIRIFDPCLSCATH